MTRFSALIITVTAVLGSAYEVRGQEHSIGVWAGVTQDLKPNPFSGTVEQNSAVTIGAIVLFGSRTRRPMGISASWSRFSGVTKISVWSGVRIMAVISLSLHLYKYPKAGWFEASLLCR